MRELSKSYFVSKYQNETYVLTKYQNATCLCSWNIIFKQYKLDRDIIITPVNFGHFFVANVTYLDNLITKLN